MVSKIRRSCVLVASLAGCLDEGAVVTSEPVGGSTSTGEAPTTSTMTEVASTSGEEPTSEPPLMTTDVAPTSAGESSGSTGPGGVCGDGVRDPGEGCDDGNRDDGDECPGSCVSAVCGDGFVKVGLEVCDDGNKVNDDACTNACTEAACGDGVIQSEVEACDDGDLEDDDWCTAACEPAVCGDGVVHAGHEACDDGNQIDDDDCHDDCTTPYCGDGEVQDGVEQCDDGDLEDDDECTSMCTAAMCGDGFVQVGVEDCDDGNGDGGDECTAMCTLAVCGDGVVLQGVEECDDMNLVNVDECSNKCMLTPTGVALGGGEPTLQVGGLMAGMLFEDACSMGQVVTGFAGELANTSHGKLGGRCKQLGLVVENEAFVIQTTGNSALPVRGGAGGMAWNRNCKAGQVVIGFSGRADTGVDQLVFTCAPLVVAELMDGTFVPQVGAPEMVMPVGGNNGVVFAETDCPIGQVATVQRIRASTGVDAFGLGCSAVLLTFE